MGEAREGTLSTRAAAQTAYRVRVLREGLGRTLDEESALEEVGGILEAELAHNIHVLRLHYEKAHS